MPENILQIIIRARDEASKNLKATDKQLESTGKTVAAVGKKFLIAGAAIGVALGVTIKKAGEFQEQMSLVATMLGEQSDKYMPGFETAIKSMAVTYGQSTATLSKGLYDILSASVSAEEATKFLETSVRAAEAGFVDAGLTADALTTVVNAYGLAASRAGDISDWFFAIVEKGKTTMAELAPTIGLVLPLSKELGVSLEEVGASLTVMTRGGIQTNIAVTSLKALMGAFLKPTKELAAETKKWGFESAAAAMKQLGMTEVLKRLSEVEKARLPRLIEEKTALTGLLTILDKRNEFMEDSISISNRAGKTDEMLAKRQDNLNVQMRKLKEGVTVLMVEIGTALIPVVQVLTKVFGALLTIMIKAEEAVEDFSKASEKQLEQTDKLIEKGKEWEGTHKALLLVKAHLLQKGVEETSEAIKNLDLRIAKLKEKEEVEREETKKTEEEVVESVQGKTEKQLEAEKKLREEIELLKAGESEKEKIRLEEDVDGYRKAKADESLIDELLDLKRAEIAEKRMERERQMASQIMGVSANLIGNLLQGEINRIGAETSQGKELARTKVLIESGVATAKIWASVAGAGPLAPVLAAAQTALILTNIKGQLSNIAALEKGGIVKKPTLAMIGEKGPEAVIPLKAGARATAINIIIQFPSVTTFKDWEEASPTRIKEVTRRKLLPALQDLAREGLVI